MNNPQTPTALEAAPEAPSRRGFPDVRCIRCGDPDRAVSVDLHDVCTFRCSQCEEEFTAEDVRLQLRGWGEVLAWVASAPALPAD
jgi:hypothetical protein